MEAIKSFAEYKFVLTQATCIFSRMQPSYFPRIGPVDGKDNFLELDEIIISLFKTDRIKSRV